MNYSISKKEKVDDRGGRDLLSDLPLSIIHNILALIPIREAVRTSVLSTEWRYTWTTLPHLVFDDKIAGGENKTDSKYEDIITRVLFCHKGPIHKFNMTCPGKLQNEWIFCLSRNDIRELDLELWPDESSLMHSSIYSCKKLTYLSLSRCELDPPPLTFKGFLFLRYLSLFTVGLPPDGINSLVAVCPLLESFELVDEGEYEVKISAPNLKYMYLAGDHEKICINAPLMTEISVQMEYDNIEGPDQELKSLACDYAKCLGGFTNLQKLSGSFYFTKYLSLGIELSHHSLVFHHLKFIDLDHVNFEDVKEIMVVARLVIGAPNLQELKMRAEPHVREDDESDSEAPHLSFKELGCAPNFKLEKLSGVCMYNIYGLTLEVELLKFLLECSPVLETMSIKLLFHTNKEKRNNLRAKLQGCNWASPIVKLCNLTWATSYTDWPTSVDEGLF